MSERGLSIQDLPSIYREGYLYAVEFARAQHDPNLEWVQFSDTLWNYLIGVFGLDAVVVPIEAALARPEDDGDVAPEPESHSRACTRRPWRGRP